MRYDESASARQCLDFGTEATVGGVDHDDLLLPVPMCHFVLHRHLQHELSCRRLPLATAADPEIPLFEISHHEPSVDYNAYVGMVCCIACGT